MASGAGRRENGRLPVDQEWDKEAPRVMVGFKLGTFWVKRCGFETGTLKRIHRF